MSLYQSVQLFEGNRVTAGVDYMHIYGNAYYTSKATDEILDTPNKQSGKSYRNEIAGYVDFRQDLLDWLTIDLGARVDHHSITGTEFIPQGGIVVRPIETGEIKAMASKGFRNPTMREMYLYPPSNTDLEPERLWNYELSWKHRLRDCRRLSCHQVHPPLRPVSSVEIAAGDGFGSMSRFRHRLFRMLACQFP